MKNEEIICSAKLSYIILLRSLVYTIILLLIFNEYPEIKFFIIFIAIIDIIYTSIKISLTKLEFTEKRIIGKTGILNINMLDAPLNKVNDINIKRTLSERLCGCSTIIISTSTSKYNFMYVKNALEFKDALINEIDNTDTKTNDNNYDKLKQLKQLLDDKVITKEDFEKEKKKLLK